MPQRRQRLGQSLTRLVFLAAALSLLSAVLRRERAELLKSSPARRRKIRLAPKRIAATLAFTTLFFAGAALSAGAGNTVVKLIDPSSSSDESALSADTTSTATTDEQAPAPAPEPATTESAPAEPAAPPVDETSPSEPHPAAAPQSQQPAASPAETAQAQVTQRARKELAATHAAPSHEGARQRGNHGSAFHRAPPVLKPQPMALRAPVDREPEADEPGVAATIWLQRLLPDPTPPSRRLTPAFARRLLRVSARKHVDWALTLAVLRASGERGSMPATLSRLQYLTKRLAGLDHGRNAWTQALALEGRTSFADRTLAMQRLYHAVGIQALVRGYDWAKPKLEKRVLTDPRVTIYPGGRGDIQSHRVNVRILALIEYLAEAHGQVTVSCLISGHRLYARPGVISAHIYGLAADISSLGGISIFGHQQPHSVTEEAVRNILLLPSEMQPRQVISLLGLGGPSFPLANHDDHIHVGY